MASQPTDAEIIDLSISSRFLDLHTAIDAIIVTYDASKKTCSCKPVTKRAIKFRTEDEVAHEELPIIQNVPVMFPEGSLFHITWPLLPGDSVQLVFNEVSNAAYRETGKPSEPGDLRRHSLSYPRAYPGPGSNARITAAHPTKMVIGTKDGTTQILIDPITGQVQLGAEAAVSPVVLNVALLAYLQALELVIAALSAVPGMASVVSTFTGAATALKAALGSTKVQAL